MSQELKAVFDGTVLQHKEPLNLVPGTRVRIIVESISPSEVEAPESSLQTVQSLQLQGKSDWSERIEQHLYGETPADEE